LQVNSLSPLPKRKQLRRCHYECWGSPLEFIMDFPCASGQKCGLEGGNWNGNANQMKRLRKYCTFRWKDVCIGVVKVTLTGEPTDLSVSLHCVSSQWWQRRMHGSVASHENCMEAYCSAVHLGSHFTACMQLL
jgi:hypothetical protein